MAKKKKKKEKEVELVGFLGVGLDETDGHQRVTRSEHFILVGGSGDTHERMQETAIRFDAALKKKGKTLRQTPPDEAIDLLRDALE